LREAEPRGLGAPNELSLGRSPFGRAHRAGWPAQDSGVTAPGSSAKPASPPPADRVIIHVDLDAFFAAVEQRDRPELRGKPVIVGGGGPDRRGVVSTASYEARRFGVRSAMPLRTAGRLCPDGIFLPVDGRKYQRVSREVMAILRRFTPLVEPLSIDEAFLDVTASRLLFGDGAAIALAIKAAVRSEVGLTISAGVATTKLVAKIASDLRKPDGLVVVPPGTEAAFLAPLPISRLWGVGPKTGAVLAEHGVATIGDLAGLDPAALGRGLGSHASTLVWRAHGHDADRVVGEGEPAKSIGHEHTFDQDTADAELIERTLLAMADGVAGRLRSSNALAATVTVKVRDSAFRTVTRQRTLPRPTDLTEPIFEAALTLARPEVRGKRIRLVGVTASGLQRGAQLGLFEAEADRRHRLAEASDTLRRRFGQRAVTRARLLRSGLPAPFERDPGTAVERRSEHAADRLPNLRSGLGRRTGGPSAGRDKQPDTAALDDRVDDERDAEPLDIERLFD
jgi:DNA polymerase-4